MRIYLDHNATTPIDPAVAEAMDDALRNCFGNPSSVHAYGQTAKAALDEGRSAVSDLINGQPSEILFTGSGTEADNLALRGIAAASQPGKKNHLVASTIEHEAVLNTLKALSASGWTTSLLPVDATGIVDPTSLEQVITDKTALVSVMHANNEIGTIQPISELAAIAHQHGATFHTDAIQTAGKHPINVSTLGVDLLSISGHKFNGPKGVGALWIRRGTRLVSTITGGGQEKNRRAGTENVPAIVGLGVAARLAKKKVEHQSNTVGKLRDKLESGILSDVPNTFINGPNKRVPNTTNISFTGVEAESLLIALDLAGIAVSTGSACSSGTLQASHVLKAMGLSTHRAQNSIRFSLGLNNTDSDITRTIRELPTLVHKLRALSNSGS